MRKQYTRVQYNEQGEKQCTRCLEYKNISEFHKYSKAQDSLKPWCKPCVRDYDLAEDDPKRKMPRKLNENGQVHCRNCGGYFDKANMVASKNGKYKGLTYCLDCSPLISRIHQMKKYKLTVERYHEILAEQDYSCKICKGHEDSYRKRLSVDHDHSCCPGEKSCGKCVRGLLCSGCNMILGNAKDDVKILQSAIDYLKSNRIITK